jgi:hypothetical protein
METENKVCTYCNDPQCGVIGLCDVAWKKSLTRPSRNLPRVSPDDGEPMSEVVGLRHKDQ